VLERLHGPLMGVSLLAGQLRAARRFSPHVILASWLHPDGYGAARLARALGVPLVVKAHGSDANVLSASPARREQVQHVLARADAVIAVSAALRDRLLALGARKASTCVVYNGVDRALFRPGDRAAARSTLGLEHGARYVLYVGNLKVSKGCEDLLHAIAAAAGGIEPDVRLVFAGSGPDSNRIVDLATSLRIENRVQFLGGVSHDMLPVWYRSADLVCLPSHNEGVPNVLLEAMACGVPVVATRVGGIPEVVPRQAGLLVEARDVIALHEALLVALNQSWPTGDITRHAERFDWTTSARAVRAILERVTRNGHRLTGDRDAGTQNPPDVTPADSASC